MLKIATAALLALGLAGCASAAMEGANIAKDKVIVEQNIDQAKAGNAEAQYKVGDAMCCAMDADQAASFYDTRQAVAWLCAAATQGYGPAAYKLGRIYSGETIDGVRVMRRVAQRVMGASENEAVAYAWLRQAQSQNVDGAKSKAESLWKSLNDAQRQRATQLVQSPHSIPCQWNDVIGAAG